MAKAPKSKVKTRNPQDVTLRNVRAANKRIGELKEAVSDLTGLIANLARRVKALESRQAPEQY